MKNLYFFLFMIALIFLACSPDEPQTAGADVETTLGELQHGFDLSEATKEKFEEGLLLLHNFEYDDALTAFEAATALDSTEVMTHWGEAMCNYKALWRLQNTEKGKEILARLGGTEESRLASITDPIKKDMWKIVEIMYGEGEFEERNKRIAGFLSILHKRNPNHQEIAAFYALSLIWATEEYGNGSPDLRLAASIADKVIEKNPLHPGALHYKIHALDGPTSAKDAHDTADAYAKVAADAAHALHMPSHIYLALGEWDGVINSNRASYDASVVRMKAKDLKDGARGYHSLAWLHYALLQQGRYKEAQQILDDMMGFVPNDPTKGARGYLLGMQNRQLVESGPDAIKTKLITDVKTDDIGILSQSNRSFLRAQIAFRNKKAQNIKEEIDWLKGKISTAAQQVEGDGLVMCAAGTSRYAPTDNSIKSAKVIMAQMKAMKALIEGKEDVFESQMKEAVALEQETNFPAGPPKIALPSFEQYGEWLISKGKHEKAIAQFDKALERMPRRSKSLKGKLLAFRQLDKKNEADMVEKVLKNILAQAD
jgi:tetratricopeptide (TPR) repeat protein